MNGASGTHGIASASRGRSTVAIRLVPAVLGAWIAGLVLLGVLGLAVAASGAEPERGPGSPPAIVTLSAHFSQHPEWVLAALAVLVFPALTAIRLGLALRRARRAEAALRESERFARSTVDAFSSSMAVLDETGTIIAVNRAWREFAGANGATLQAVSEGVNYLAVCDAATGPDSGTSATFAAGIRTVLGGERQYFALEYPCHSPTDRHWFDGRIMRFQGSGPTCVVVVHEDITERKRVEEKLQAALEEKTTLLKEVHHRVKNNLQIVTSLLNLQARQIHNPAALAALRDTQGRIRSMALLHETLYREGNLGRVDGAAYLAHLCAHLNGAFGAVAGRVHLRHRIDPVALALDQAVPCGLIVNELVSNAFKHAFPGERGGEIRVELRAEAGNRLALVVADDGVGLPPGLNWRHGDTLGLQLVAGLAQQLGGAVETRTDAGAAFRLAFPAHLPGEVPLS